MQNILYCFPVTLLVYDDECCICLQHFPLALMAYRSSVHESTGFSPSMLMLGREIELPIDLLYGPHSVKQGNLIGSEGSYLWNLTQTLCSIHNIARQKMKRASDRQKRQYDHKICARQYRVGDPVWVFNPTKTKGRSPKLHIILRKYIQIRSIK